ncbi:MAG: hypothetical protein K5656_11455 [Lachnospiraceae bacterium]|nr:hypothetical protein [Lachnospiraceae bacterium]
MFQFDKNMYNAMKEWIDNRRDYKADIMYINSHDRALTDLTVRKYMYNLYEEDEMGELYISLYSAKNFNQNMRDYFFEIDRLYMHKPDENAPLMEVIEDIPGTCGWIVLVVEDCELLSEDDEKNRETLQAILTFASKGAEIVLVGNKDLKDVFSQYGCDVCEVSEKLDVEEDDERLVIGVYSQEDEPCMECIEADSLDDERDELIYYWDVLYEQLEKGYFDFGSFKSLFKDTVEYIIPRVSKDQVYRKDIRLLEDIALMHAKMWRKKEESFDGCEPLQIDGCRPWEFEAAYQFVCGLNNSVINRYDEDVIKDGKVTIMVWVEERMVDYGGISISGSGSNYVDINGDNVFAEMDRLSNVICKCTYNGDNEVLWDYMLDEDGEKDDSERSDKHNEEIVNKLGMLMEGIKAAADKTINRERGVKVHRCKTDQEDCSISENVESELSIDIKEYDMSICDIKGYERIKDSLNDEIESCKVIRAVVMLDQSRYLINDNGEYEMTFKAQKEYDDFIMKYHGTMDREEMHVVDEGYGCGEDELDWHITACVQNEEGYVNGVVEVQVCVRADETRS